MKIMFDIMGTVFGVMDYSLRPGVKDAISALRASGATIGFWTWGAAGKYIQLLKNCGIEGEIYSKQGDLPFTPDICVDDQPEGWMPGRHYKVAPHISEDASGGPIQIMELLYSFDGRSFYWD